MIVNSNRKYYNRRKTKVKKKLKKQEKKNLRKSIKKINLKKIAGTISIVIKNPGSNNFVFGKRISNIPTSKIDTYQKLATGSLHLTPKAATNKLIKIAYDAILKYANTKDKNKNNDTSEFKIEEEKLRDYMSITYNEAIIAQEKYLEHLNSEITRIPRIITQSEHMLERMQLNLNTTRQNIESATSSDIIDRLQENIISIEQSILEVSTKKAQLEKIIVINNFEKQIINSCLGDFYEKNIENIKKYVDSFINVNRRQSIN